MFTLNNLVLAAGLIQLLILVTASLVPKVTDWKRNLEGSDPFFKSLVWTYGFFIFLIVASIALFSLFETDLLTDGNATGKYVCGFISVFWGARLFIQFFIFKTPEFLKTGAMKFGYNALTLAFMYLTITYGLVAFT
ncbi:MAG TPA: hypothetical protein VLB82_02840 [Thermodesulfobacteriota bacterium]|nr:hypothetical protein [Thermodesulfobacteriota bacterium]